MRVTRESMLVEGGRSERKGEEGGGGGEEEGGGGEIIDKDNEYEHRKR